MPPSEDETANASPPGGADVMLPLSHYAMLVGLCQFIPVPFVDDWIERRLMKRVVTLVLQRRGRTFAVEDVRGLYRGEGGLIKTVLGIGKALVLKPIKKLLRTVFIVFGVRQAVLNAAAVLLVGHTLDRLLAAGWFAESAKPVERREQAKRVSAAVKEAWKGADRRALMDLIRSSGRLLNGQGGEVTTPPADALRQAAEMETADDLAEDVDRVAAQLPEDQRRRLDSAADDLSRRLTTGEGQSWLARFDADVDRHLNPVS